MTNGEFLASLISELREACERRVSWQEPVRISAEVAYGIATFLLASDANVRDAERLDGLDKLGHDWRVAINGKVIGQGRVRSALDQAITAKFCA
jgi:hypothetical protein